MGAPHTHTHNIRRRIPFSKILKSCCSCYVIVRKALKWLENLKCSNILNAVKDRIIFL